MGIVLRKVRVLPEFTQFKGKEEEEAGQMAENCLDQPFGVGEIPACLPAYS